MAQRVCVMIVEDDEDIRESFAMLLTAEGYDVMTAVDGLDALEQLRARRPDVIMLDLMMPRMNGWEVVESLRADPALATIPVFVVSAVGDREPPACEQQLTKPVDVDELLSVLRRHHG